MRVFREFSRTAEVRYLARGVMAVLGLLGLLLAARRTAWWPGAVEFPWAMLAEGHADQALHAWLRMADGWGPRTVRNEALWRAGAVAAVDLDRPGLAVELLRRYVHQAPDGPHVAEAHARLATLYRIRLEDPVRAADAWIAAVRAAPDDPHVGRWLLESGRALAQAGVADRATRVLHAAARHPEVAIAAWLALGRLHLPTDPASAYADFDAALQAGATGTEAVVAQLGRATALERLEMGHVALAELDQAVADGERDPALERRRRRLAEEHE